MGLFPIAAGPAGTASLRAGREAARWVRWLARLGFAAKGVVYLVIGAIAVRAAVTGARSPEDSGGALRSIAAQPFGRVLLGALLVGIAGHVLWRLVQALLDPEREAHGAKGVVRRVGYLISAGLYAGVAAEALRLLTGSGGGEGGDRQAEHWTAVAMQQPAGRWIVAVVGAGVIAFGLYEIHRGIRSNLRKRLDPAGAGTVPDAVVRFGRLGLAARGVVFLLIGGFLLQAARDHDATEAAGLEGALQALQGQAYGPVLLGVVAAGLVGYGLWQLVQARYRVIRTR